MNDVLEYAEMREKDLGQKFAQNLLQFHKFAFKIFGCKAKAAFSSGNYSLILTLNLPHLYSFVNLLTLFVLVLFSFFDRSVAANFDYVLNGTRCINN